MLAPFRGGGLETGPFSQEKMSKNCKKTMRIKYRMSCRRVADQYTQDLPCEQVPEAHRELKK